MAGIVETSEDKIIRAMVERTVELFPKLDAPIGDVVLEARQLAGRNGVSDVSLQVRRGEILGLAGLVGAGRTETIRLICGADPKTSGTVLIDGEEVRINSPADAVRCGIGWVPEDRKQHGLILGMDIKQNTTLAVLRRVSNMIGTIKSKDEREITEHYVQSLSIVTSGISKAVATLSGGNQQKVVLSKWLASHPKVLILDEPTRGIDVGAKAEVHALMSRLAQQGLAIVMISSEMQEVISMSDRVIVICQGRVTGEFQRDELSQERIMTAATKFLAIDVPEPHSASQSEASLGGNVHE